MKKSSLLPTNLKLTQHSHRHSRSCSQLLPIMITTNLQIAGKAY
ncbi:hypothetical protein M8C21_033302 [Ambrosia artemisiifolia]|uniref:Uncharacterized protein n=1 Tax=Ambrosia artemisiifolia TaxID=4212 RepID=A0AAD5BUX9_AMBAR|nr:hypothetical protein M8C21_033302 [Ambrosia artemisiifolia]